MKVLQQVTQLFLSCAGALWLFTNKVPTRRGQGSKVKLDTEQKGKKGKMWKRRCKHNRALSFPVVRVRRARPERISRVDLHSTKHKSLGFREHDVRRALLLPWEDVHRSYERIRRGARETHAKNECGGRTKAMQTKDRIDFAYHVSLSFCRKHQVLNSEVKALIRSVWSQLHFAYAGPRPHRQVWQELCNTESLKEISKKCPKLSISKTIKPSPPPRESTSLQIFDIRD